MPTAKRDYYEILGVPRDADQKAIERGYHGLACRYHPDVSKEPDAVEKFKEVSEAYAVLSDPEKRRRYDSGGFAGVAGYSYDDLFGGLDLGSLFAGRDLNFGTGFFDGLFGGHRRSGPRKGASIEVGLTVPLERILNGGEETVHIVRPEACSVCHGSRARPGTEPRSCEACGGTGQHLQTRHEGNTIFKQITTCRECSGRGNIIDEPCPECSGRGQIERKETLTVKIPLGIDEGRALRIAGRGHPSLDAGGPPGDLLVIVTSKDDSRFERQGPNLWRAETIEVADAALGTRRSVRTLNGEAIMTIPAGTQPNRVLRLRGEGLPHFAGSARGDLYISVHVHIPEELSEEERELYERLRQLQQKGTDRNVGAFTDSQLKIQNKGPSHETQS